jgi:hypothetical protein
MLMMSQGLRRLEAVHVFIVHIPVIKHFLSDNTQEQR